jgi:PAS domain S-box-containing protein
MHETRSWRNKVKDEEKTKQHRIRELTELCQLVAELEAVENERKRAEETLRESKEKYRNIVECANDGIAIVQDALIKYINPRSVEIAGYTVAEETGTPFADYIYPDEVPKVVDYYNRHIAGEKVRSTYETALRHRNDSRIEVERNTSIITYQGRHAAFAIIRDITERNRLEAQFHQA